MAARLDDEESRMVVEVGGDHEQLGIGAPGDKRLLTIQHEAVAGSGRLGLELEGIEECMRLVNCAERQRERSRR